jgi:hypothetical protein
MCYAIWNFELCKNIQAISRYPGRKVTKITKICSNLPKSSQNTTFAAQISHYCLDIFTKFKVSNGTAHLGLQYAWFTFLVKKYLTELKNGIFTYLARSLAHQNILMPSIWPKCAPHPFVLSGILFCPKICPSCWAVIKEPSIHHFLP